MRRVKVGGADEEDGWRARIQETEPLAVNEGAKSLTIDVGVLLPLAKKTIPAFSPRRSALNHIEWEEQHHQRQGAVLNTFSEIKFPPQISSLTGSH